MNDPSYTPPDLSLFGDEHVRLYQETDGAVGHDWNGVPALVLTTTGRRSGAERHSALIYGEHDGSYVVVASQGGMPTHPNWYHNLVAEPAVRVQVGARHLAARARIAEGDERTQLWELMASIWPNYDVYQTRTDRVIPVVVLDPVA